MPPEQLREDPFLRIPCDDKATVRYDLEIR